MSNRPNVKPNQRRAATTASGKRVVAAQKESRVGVGIVVGVGIAILACLLAAVVIAGRGSGKNEISAAAAASGVTLVPKGTIALGEVTVEGTALPERPDGSADDPAVGKPAPALAGQQLDGSAITIPASGKAKIVMFLAHWCPHCQKEVPILSEHIRDKGLPEGVDLFAVTTSTNEEAPNYPPGPWLEKEGWPVPTLVDDAEGSAATAYGIGGFPYFAVVDAAGNVVARTSGELTIAQFEQLIDAARSGTSPAAA